MNQMLNKHLIKIIVEVAISLEFCSDDMVDQDYAVQIMENVAAELQLMHKVQKDECIKIIKEISNNYTSEKKEFVRQLCENLGLIEIKA